MRAPDQSTTRYTEYEHYFFAEKAGIDILVTEAVVQKIIGKHDACKRNNVGTIFVINIVRK